MEIPNQTRKNPVYYKIYMLWYNMMKRCYNPNFERYKDYGGVGCVVCDEWKNLNGFIQTIDLVDGFDINKILKGELCLDKDIKVKGNKIYSVANCKFVLKKENNKFKPNQQKTIIGISPDGKIFEFVNQSEFSKNHNLSQGKISDCANNKITKYKGWTFYFK